MSQQCVVVAGVMVTVRTLVRHQVQVTAEYVTLDAVNATIRIAALLAFVQSIRVNVLDETDLMSAVRGVVTTTNISVVVINRCVLDSAAKLKQQQRGCQSWMIRASVCRFLICRDLHLALVFTIVQEQQ